MLDGLGQLCCDLGLNGAKLLDGISSFSILLFPVCASHPSHPLYFPDVSSSRDLTGFKFLKELPRCEIPFINPPAEGRVGAWVCEPTGIHVEMNSENCTLWDEFKSQLSSSQGTETKCSRQINHNKTSLILHCSKPPQLLLS